MKERNLIFRVDHPQLQRDVGNQRLGVKRYHLHKNLHSNFLSFGNQNYQVGSRIIYNSHSPEPRRSDYSRCSSRIEEYNFSPPNATRYLKESPPFNNIRLGVQERRNTRFSRLGENLLNPPMFTKYRPLVVKTDPINGNSFVPDSNFYA